MTETQHRTHVWDPHEHRMAAGTPNTLSSLTAPRGGTRTGKWFLSTLVIMQFLVKKDFFFLEAVSLLYRTMVRSNLHGVPKSHTDIREPHATTT